MLLVLRGPQMGVTEPLPHRVKPPVVGIWATVPGTPTAICAMVERGNIVSGGAAERTLVDL